MRALIDVRLRLLPPVRDAHQLTGSNYEPGSMDELVKDLSCGPLDEI